MIKGLLFDLNGTVIDIYTSESDDQIYRTLSNFLDYYRVKISPQTIKDEYFSILKQQKNLKTWLMIYHQYIKRF